MFPIRDTHTSGVFPFVNLSLILINLAVFLYQISLPSPDGFIMQYAFIPQNFSFSDIASYSTILTSMFLHGGWFHLLSNMWFLHIFGDNIEGSLGHIKYLMFYLLCGVAAVFAQYATDLFGILPMIGASGAISGVTGAYFALFKHAKIEAIVPTFFGLLDIITLPAWFFLGYWLVLQIFSGVGSLVSIETQSGGVAFFAHIGGFIAGYILVTIFKPSRGYTA